MKEFVQYGSYVSLECVGERGKFPGNLKNASSYTATCSPAEISGSFREISASILNPEVGEASFSTRLQISVSQNHISKEGIVPCE